MAQRFSFAYKNPAYSSLDKKFSKNNICYSLIYDSNRIELVSQMLNFNNLNKEIDVYYNSVNAPISSIVSLQNQIRGVKKEITKLQEQTAKYQEQLSDYQEQTAKYQEQLTEYQEQTAKYQEQMMKYQNNHALDMSIMNIRIFNISKEEIEKKLDMCIAKKSLSPLADLEKYNQSFIKASIALKKTLPSDDLIFINDRVLSEKLPNSDYLNFISLLNEKINKKTFANEYYIHYRNAITGIKYLVSNGTKYDYPNYSKEISEILKNILAFIYLLDKEPLLLNCFFACVLYYAFDISKSDKRYSNFYEKLKPSEVDKCVLYFINSINSSFL